MSAASRFVCNLALFLCGLAFILVGVSVGVSVGGFVGPLVFFACLAVACACSQDVR